MVSTPPNLILKTASRLIDATGFVLSLHERRHHLVRCLWVLGIDERAAVEVVHSSDTVDGMQFPRVAELAGSLVLHCALCNNEDEFFILSTVRSDLTRPFQKCEIVPLQSVMPVFEWMLKREMQPAQSEKVAAGWQILDHFQMGVILATVDGHVTGANRYAMNLLTTNKNVTITNGRVRLRRASENTRFQHALCETAGAERHRGHAMAIEPEDGTGILQIRIMYLGSLQSRDIQQPFCAIFISDSNAIERPSSILIQELFGLTRVEAEVVGLMCEGSSPTEVAEKLDITANTVRGHLKAIFHKIGIHRQADLIRIMAAGPGQMCK